MPEPERERGDVGSGHSFDIGCIVPLPAVSRRVRTLGLLWQQAEVQIEEPGRLCCDPAEET